MQMLVDLYPCQTSVLNLRHMSHASQRQKIFTNPYLSQNPLNMYTQKLDSLKAQSHYPTTPSQASTPPSPRTNTTTPPPRAHTQDPSTN